VNNVQQNIKSGKYGNFYRNGGRDWLDVQMIGEGMAIFIFYFSDLICKFSFFFLFLVILFLLLTAINLLMFVSMRKILLLVLLTGVLVFKFGRRLDLFHTLMFPYFW